MKKKKNEKAKQDPELLDKPIFSDKKNVFRLIAFIAAFAIAVTAITIGVVQIGKKDPGLYEVEAETNGTLPFYASGIHLKYYFEGSSDQIKAQIGTVKSIYSESLKLTYQWFDTEETYPETPNLAKISQNVGQPVKLQKEFFGILKDALEKNARNEGYSIFTAPLIGYRETLLYANDPSSFDPANEAENREFLQGLAKIIRTNPGTLTLNESDYSATLTISEAYQAFITEYELEGYGILDLGVLADAYRVSYLAKVLEENGYTNGYLTTDSGITVLLGSYGENASFCLYSPGDDSPVLSATKTASTGSAACSLRVFPFTAEEPGFYSLEKGSKTLYRNPYQITFQDEQPILSVLMVAKEKNAVEATYACVCVLAKTNLVSAIDFAKSTGLDFILDGNDKETRLYAANTEGLETAKGYQVILP